MIEQPSLKRYAITVQHEVIVYAYEHEKAKETACRAYAKTKCIGVKELPPVESEGITVIDHQKAPGV